MNPDSGYAALLAMLVFVPAAAVLAAVLARFFSRRRDHSERLALPPGNAFPVIAHADPNLPQPQSVEPIHDGPGHYHIVGLMSTTGMEVRTRVEAQSMAGAEVEAQLHGIIVVEIVKE